MTRATTAPRRLPCQSHRPTSEEAAAARGGPDWQVDQLSDWAAGPDPDRLVVELWVAGVEGLAASQPRTGGGGE